MNRLDWAERLRMHCRDLQYALRMPDEVDSPGEYRRMKEVMETLDSAIQDAIDLADDVILEAS